MSSYKDHLKLGGGGFGEVWRVIRDDGEPFAKKVLNDNSQERLNDFNEKSVSYPALIVQESYRLLIHIL